MDLFAINRYEADEKASDPSKEERLLERLRRNIERNKDKLKTQNDDKIASAAEIAEQEQLAALQQNNNVETPMEVDNVDETPENGTQKKSQKDLGADFMILGDDQFKRKQKVQVVLPNWLAYPTVISRNLSENSTPIDDLDYISPKIKACLNNMNIPHLFPVQEAVIPWILKVHKKPSPFRPRDICVSAPTGSGKTLAYTVPIVEHLSTYVDRKIRALIVLPVNELAVQVLKVFQKLCEPTGLKCTLLSKFVSFETEQIQLVEQFNGEYYSKVDIVVATTGRLVEHIHATKGFCLKSLRFLVMDEADRIMEQIQNNWLYHLDTHVKEQSDSFLSGRLLPLCYDELCTEASEQPHKLLFSATLSQDPEKLQSLRLFQPKLFTSIVVPFAVNNVESNGLESTNRSEQRGDFIGKFTTPAELTEQCCYTEARIKPLTLYTLIKENGWKKFLCFANSGESAHRLSYVLQNLFGSEMQIEELSSGLSISLRNSVLLKFQTNKIDGIICSDALARGIDIPEVDVVISYDAPRHVKTYIHRIGRTARAGRPGIAVTLLAPNEINSFKAILKEGGKADIEEIKVTENAEENKAKDYANALDNMQNALKREKQIKMEKVLHEKNKANAGKQGFIGQLQAQIQRQGFMDTQPEQNIPESWKWENQSKVNTKKERKGKNKNNKKKNKANKAQAND